MVTKITVGIGKGRCVVYPRHAGLINERFFMKIYIAFLLLVACSVLITIGIFGQEDKQDNKIEPGDIIKVLNPNVPETRAAIRFSDMVINEKQAGTVFTQTLYIEACKHGYLSVFDKDGDQLVKMELRNFPSSHSLDQKRFRNTIYHLTAATIAILMREQPGVTNDIDIFYLGKKISIYPKTVTSESSEDFQTIADELVTLLTARETEKKSGELRHNKTLVAFSVDHSTKEEFEDIVFCKPVVYSYSEE